MKKIFVFGSNLSGIHGAGAALYARKHYGAELSVGIGRTGDSYAIPTKDHKINTLSLDVIEKYVDEFIFSCVIVMVYLIIVMIVEKSR